MKTLEKLNPNKSTGLDQIGPKILKLSAPLITRALTHIINISIATSEYPELLKKAKIIPVFKKGCKNQPENYRPISILPTLSKIFEKHVSSSIFEYLNKNNLIHKEQSGFRSQHSCQTALTKLTETWLDEMNKGNLTGVVYLDFSKAFDLVNHQLLLSKLECYNFHHSAIEWISSYLSERTQQVTIGNKSSEQKPIPRGVPQGSVLGPLLFLIFINDLPMSTCESNIDLFADDSTLHNSGPSVQCVENNLRSDLKEVQDWCENNDMYINVDKTKTMLLTTSQRSARLQKKELSLHIHETEIEQVSHHKLLGIHVDKFLHWDIQVQELFKRINSKINLLSKIKKYLTTEARLLYFNSYILPLFDYCCTIWGNCSKKDLERMTRLQKKAARIILGKYDVASKKLFADLNWLDFANRIKFHKCILVFKIVNGLSPPYLQDLLRQIKSSSTSSLRSAEEENLLLPGANLEIFKKSLQFSGVCIWNSLPSHIKKSKSLNNFKEKCQKYMLDCQNSSL